MRRERVSTEQKDEDQQRRQPEGEHHTEGQHTHREGVRRHGEHRQDQIIRNTAKNSIQPRQHVGRILSLKIFIGLTQNIGVNLLAVVSPDLRTQQALNQRGAVAQSHRDPDQCNHQSGDPQPLIGLATTEHQHLGNLISQAGTTESTHQPRQQTDEHQIKDAHQQRHRQQHNETTQTPSGQKAEQPGELGQGLAVEQLCRPA